MRWLLQNAPCWLVSYRTLASAAAPSPFLRWESVSVQDDGVIGLLCIHTSRSDTTIHRGASQI